LQVLEVHRGLTPLGLGVLIGETAQQVLQQVAVPGRELLECSALDRAPYLLVRRRALPAAAERPEVDDALGEGAVGHHQQRLFGVAALGVSGAFVVEEASRCLSERLDPLGERSEVTELELELPPGRPQGLVDARQHPPEPRRPVRRQQAQTLAVAACAEAAQGALERLTAEDGGARIVELAKARIEPDRERVGLEEPVAEAVDCRDPGPVELAGEIRSSAFEQRRADPGAQLGRRLARVRDHEDRVDVEPALAGRADEPLDEDARLARARPRRDEHIAGGLRGRKLFSVEPGLGLERCHARSTRQIGQRSHQAGQPSPFGSWRTSPARIRCANSPARVRAESTWAQNASSSR
jgi:hypothetical protein